MADRLTRGFCMMVMAVSSAYAEDLIDPTRPPVSITVPVAAGSAAPKAAGLQSIIISKNRRAAIIDGETVELGGRYGDVKLLEINESSVVLSGAQGRQVLTLFPDVKITGKQEIKTNQSSPLGEVQTGKRIAKPVARKEEK